MTVSIISQCITDPIKMLHKQYNVKTNSSGYSTCICQTLVS